MRSITEQELISQHNALPEKLRRAIDEPRTTTLIDDICDRYEASDDDREIFKTFAGYVMLGVIPIRDFFLEVNDYLDATDATTTEICREINRDLFVPYADEIVEAERAFDATSRNRIWREKLAATPAAPLSASTLEQKSFSQETPTPTPMPTRSFPPSPQPFSSPLKSPNGVERETAPPTKPLVIHESKEVSSVGSSLPSRSLSPFNMLFSNKKASLDTKTAHVEAPKERVVHYSEARTTLTPFDKDSDVIDLELFGAQEKENTQ